MGNFSLAFYRIVRRGLNKRRRKNTLGLVPLVLLNFLKLVFSFLLLGKLQLFSLKMNATQSNNMQFSLFSFCACACPGLGRGRGGGEAKCLAAAYDQRVAARINDFLFFVFLFSLLVVFLFSQKHCLFCSTPSSVLLFVRSGSERGVSSREFALFLWRSHEDAALDTHHTTPQAGNTLQARM